MSCHVNIMSMSCQYHVNVMFMSCQYHVNGMSLSRPCYIHVHVHFLVLVFLSQPSSKLILCTQKFHCVHRSSFQCYSATHENIVFKGESSTRETMPLQTLDMKKKTISFKAQLFLLPWRAKSGCIHLISPRGNLEGSSEMKLKSVC